MPGVIGLVGVLLCFAGAHMLWMARHEILYWMDTYILLFRRSFDAARRDQPTPSPPVVEEARAVHGLQQRPRERREMWLMLAGIALICIGLAAASITLARFVLHQIGS